MATELIVQERRGSIAWITLNRAAERNALTPAMIGALTSIFSLLKEDDAVRVIVLTGAGEEAFCRGWDWKELRGLQSSQLRALGEEGRAFTELVENIGKPVIAAINGRAYGYGCELVLACHFRLATSNAEFAQSDILPELNSCCGSMQRLARTIGRARALEMGLTGEASGADEALQFGLISKLTPDAISLQLAATELAEKLARNAPLAMKYAMTAVSQGSALPLADALRLESELFELSIATDDLREGTQAFLEKRLPEFTGK